MKEIAVKLTCINQTETVYSEHKRWSQESLIQTGFSVLTSKSCLLASINSGTPFNMSLIIILSEIYKLKVNIKHIMTYTNIGIGMATVQHV